MAYSALLYPLAFLLLIVAGSVADSLTLRRDSARTHALRHLTGLPSLNGADGNDPELELLPIVLVASVDGKFHALNRTTGAVIWSMPSTATATTTTEVDSGGTPTPVPSALDPLVRTKHVEYDPDFDEDPTSQETYIIEPQSGDIYVSSSPSGSLQRLPLSMPQLVDMSPFSFGDGDRRVFVGRKKTSLMVLELETGRVKAALDSECPWDPFEELVDKEEEDIDLDELDGTIPSREYPTEVYIGRTDYHISIHTRPRSPTARRPPVRDLSFSTYGPNNQDLDLQSIYSRTLDDKYVETLPNGGIISFKTRNIDRPSDSSGVPQNDPIWGQEFSATIVAVFDVVKSTTRSDPFVLLQPRPPLQDVFPASDLTTAARNAHINPSSAYVGLVEQTGSLFALSPDNYPLVIFGPNSHDGPSYSLKGIEAPPNSNPNIDSSSHVGKAGRNTRPIGGDDAMWRALCRSGSTNMRCLVGVRPLEDGSQSQLAAKLLDGAPTVPLPIVPSHPHSNNNRVEAGAYGTVNTAAAGAGAKDQTGWNISINVVPPLGWIGVGSGERVGAGFTLGSWWVVLVGMMCGLVGWVTWNGKKGVKGGEGKIVEKVAIDEDGTMGGEVPTATETIPAKMVSEPSTSSLGAPAPAVIEPASAERGPLPTTPQTPSTPAPVRPAPPPPSVQKQLPPLPTSEPIATPTVDAALDDGGDEDSDKEGDAQGTTPGRRKNIRRRRGKKKKKEVSIDVDGEEGAEQVDGAGSGSANGDAVQAEIKPSMSAGTPTLVVPATPAPSVSPSLIVSDTVLGFGSHGTVVYQGSLQGRAVAVKRLLQDFTTLASREVAILQESDDHPNVIRYFYQESHSGFLYIALELCPASLADIVERPDQFKDISIVFEPKRALRQIVSGLRHLHGLKIVHRDIKPQNILVSGARAALAGVVKDGAGSVSGVGGGGSGMKGHRMLISDFGLCRKLEVDQTSFLPTANGMMGVGTVGWRAPEILRGEVKLDESSSTDDNSTSSRDSVGTTRTSSTAGAHHSHKPTRLTKSVDIFALGCLFYYVLTNGGHPFGDRYEREVNILKGAVCLEGLEGFGEEGSDAVDLIGKMLHAEASERPDTTTCLMHPYFWDPGRRLGFLQDASDRFEIMVRDPRDPHLVLLEEGAIDVVGPDWVSRLDKIFVENLGKFRKYDGKSVQDLLRALRNKKHHYQDLPDNVKRHVGSMPEGYLSYFTKRFPRLFLHVYNVIADSSLRHESMFRSYFEVPELS